MLIETLPILRGSTPFPLLHAERMHRSACVMGWDPIPWSTVWQRVLEHLANEGLGTSADQLLRCTIVYGEEVHEVRSVPYSIRPVHTLRVLTVPDDLDYSLKYADRSCFTAYSSQCQAGEEALLVQRGWLTDTTYTNVVLEMSDGRLLTPDTPLLEGTQRTRLISENRILPVPLTLHDLHLCRKVHLINTMMPIGALTIDHFILP